MSHLRDDLCWSEDRHQVVENAENASYFNSMQVPARPWSRPKFTTAHHHHAHTRRCHIKQNLSVWWRNEKAPNDVWTLDPPRIAGQNEVGTGGDFEARLPSPRGCHTANTVQNGLVVVGGGDGREYFQDIRCWNLVASRCTSPPSSLSIQSNVSDTAVWTQTNPGTL